MTVDESACCTPAATFRLKVKSFVGASSNGHYNMALVRRPSNSSGRSSVQKYTPMCTLDDTPAATKRPSADAQFGFTAGRNHNGTDNGNRNDICTPGGGVGTVASSFSVCALPSLSRAVSLPLSSVRSLPPLRRSNGYGNGGSGCTVAALTVQLLPSPSTVQLSTRTIVADASLPSSSSSCSPVSVMNPPAYHNDNKGSSVRSSNSRRSDVDETLHIEEDRRNREQQHLDCGELNRKKSVAVLSDSNGNRSYSNKENIDSSNMDVFVDNDDLDKLDLVTPRPPALPALSRLPSMAALPPPVIRRSSKSMSCSSSSSLTSGLVSSLSSSASAVALSALSALPHPTNNLFMSPAATASVSSSSHLSSSMSSSGSDKLITPADVVSSSRGPVVAPSLPPRPITRCKKHALSPLASSPRRRFYRNASLPALKLPNAPTTSSSFSSPSSVEASTTPSPSESLSPTFSSSSSSSCVAAANSSSRRLTRRSSSSSSSSNRNSRPTIIPHRRKNSRVGHSSASSTSAFDSDGRADDEGEERAEEAEANETNNPHSEEDDYEEQRPESLTDDEVSEDDFIPPSEDDNDDSDDSYCDTPASRTKQNKKSTTMKTTTKSKADRANKTITPTTMKSDTMSANRITDGADISRAARSRPTRQATAKRKSTSDGERNDDDDDDDDDEECSDANGDGPSKKTKKANTKSDTKKKTTAAPRKKKARTTVSDNFVRINLKKKFNPRCELRRRGSIKSGTSVGKYSAMQRRAQWRRDQQATQRAATQAGLYVDLLNEEELARASVPDEDELVATQKKQKRIEEQELADELARQASARGSSFLTYDSRDHSEFDDLEAGAFDVAEIQAKIAARSAAVAVATAERQAKWGPTPSSIAYSSSSSEPSTVTSSSSCESSSFSLSPGTPSSSSFLSSSTSFSPAAVSVSATRYANVDARSLDLQLVAKDEFGFDDFHPGQEFAIRRTLEGKSTLLMMPTGGGKSLCYQLPALLLPGLTLVVTPLLSLMQDQLLRLPRCVRGACWSSAQTQESVRGIMTEIRAGRVKILFISPEKLFSHGFQRFILSLPQPALSFACIDEAHCVSEWSHNFRPSYMRLSVVLCEMLHVSCVLALTATATAQTQVDICQSLHIPNDGVMRTPLRRDNLSLTVSRDRHREKALQELLQSPRFVSLKSIIVYVARQKQADQLATLLQIAGHSAASYHAGKSAEARKQIQNDFMSNQLHIVVATIAFGMGLDKRDIEAVIHFSMPQSLESYVQEIGRAGRDGRALAQCHTFLCDEDAMRYRSLLLADRVDRVTLKTILSHVFGKANLIEAKSKQNKQRSRHHEDESHVQFVALPNEKFERQMDIKSSVIDTVLALLELEEPECVRLLPSIHDLAGIKFYNTSQSELCQRNGMLKQLMSVAKSPRSGLYNISVCSTASHFGFHVSDIQRELLRLKAEREISVDWKKQSHCIQVRQQPGNLDDLIDRLLGRLRRQEAIMLRKIDIVSRAMSLVAVEKYKEIAVVGTMMRNVNATHKKSNHSPDPVMLQDGEEDGGEQDNSEVSVTSNSSSSSSSSSSSKFDLPVITAASERAQQSEYTLHDIIDEYFACVDDADLLRSLDSKLPLYDQLNAESVHDAKEKAEDNAELISDIEMFLRIHGKKVKTARSVARILHGIQSPCFKALDWYQNSFWGKYRACSSSTIRFDEMVTMAQEVLLQQKTATVAAVGTS